MGDESCSCEFCAIAALTVDADTVAATDDCIAFFPEEPATLGHTLVIPRIHVANLWKIQDYRLADALIRMVIRVGNALESAVSPEGMNVISSAGEAASQTIMHLHFHVVPRWRSDRIGQIWPEGGDAEMETRRAELAAVLRSLLAGGNG